MATKLKEASIAIRMKKTRDMSPKWDGADQWSGEEFGRHFRRSMDYYRLESSVKDLKPSMILWMETHGYSKNAVANFSKTKDSRCSLTVAAVAACLVKGMPAVHKEFNQGRNTETWLRAEIEKIIESGKHDTDESVEELPIKISAVPNIQDRIKEQAGQISEELDVAIDNWITDPENFNPKEFKILNLLRGKGAKAAQCRYIKLYFARSYGELLELASGNADEQLREAYRHNSRKNVKKLIEFYEGIMNACEQITAEQKVLKKPRAKKTKPAEDLVKKLKFCIKDDKLNIVSIPPSQIVGAQVVALYNVKTRKIVHVIAKSTAGIGVKGTTLTDFTEKSVQKTLRTPLVQLKEFKEQTTMKKFEQWFHKSVSTTETKFTGRLNEDIVILKAFK